MTDFEKDTLMVLKNKLLETIALRDIYAAQQEIDNLTKAIFAFERLAFLDKGGSVFGGMPRKMTEQEAIDYIKIFFKEREHLDAYTLGEEFKLARRILGKDKYLSVLREMGEQYHQLKYPEED